MMDPQYTCQIFVHYLWVFKGL